MKSKHLSRREFLAGSAGLGAGLVMAACAAPVAQPPAEPAPAEPAEGAEPAAEAPAPNAAAEPIELDVWTGWTESMAANIEQILDGYNQSQDAVVAKHTAVPDNMTQKLLAAVSAGNPPGTAVVFGASVAYQLAAQDGILPLDEIGNPDQVETLRKWMLPAIWDLGTYEGKFYYASMWNQCMGVFVNTKMCEEKGVDPTKPPATLEELDAVYDQLTTYDADGNIDVLGGDFTWVDMILGRFLGKLVSEDGKTIMANDPNNVAALEWQANRWNTVGITKLQDFYASLQGRGERSAGNDPFLSGLTATYVTGPWHFDTIARYQPDGFEFTVWPWPGPSSADKKGMYTYGDGWIIPKGSKDPAAAWDIISNLTGATGDRDVYTNLFVVWQCVNGPVSPAMVDWPLFKTDVIGKCPGYQEVFLEDLFKSDQYLFPAKIPTSDSYGALLSAEWEKARLGQKSPQEALDFVTEQAQTELDNWLTQAG
jgi:multiple sugar transport system substrate-binding protein